MAQPNQNVNLLLYFLVIINVQSTVDQNVDKLSSQQVIVTNVVIRFLTLDKSSHIW